MIKNQIAAMVAALALCGGITVGIAQDVGREEAQPGKREFERPGQAQYERDELKRHEESQAGMKVQKGSELIGKQVRNAEGEDLGKVKDFAVDLQTGRISYLVLSHGGTLGVGEKLIAVPTSLFSEEAEAEHLVLRADKEMIQRMPGFEANDWPEAPSPAWGAEQPEGDLEIEEPFDRPDIELEDDQELETERPEVEEPRL